MWLALQATVRCAACGKLTAANAATSTTCDTCAAQLTLHDDLWHSVTSAAAQRGAELDDNATVKQTLSQAGLQLRISLSRQSPRCPHCDEAWPLDAPRAPFACPGCSEEISVRELGEVVLVAEDRTLLGGERAQSEPQSVACPNCAAPVLADGSQRQPACASCGSEVVIPDEIWRRVHAPHAVARWYLWTREGSPEELRGSLSILAFCALPEGRLAALGQYADEPAVMVLDTEPLALVWSKPLPDAGQPVHIAAVGSELWWANLQAPELTRLDAATGEFLGTVLVEQTSGVHRVVPAADGTVVVQCYPSNRLERLDARGSKVALWPPSGFFGRLFGRDRGAMAYSKPVPRASSVAQGYLGLASDGMTLATTLGGTQVVRLDGSGALLGPPMGVDDVLGVHSAVASAEAVFVTGYTEQGWVLARVDAGGSQPIVESGLDGEGPYRHDATVALAPEGDVWLAGDFGVERYDAAGALRWHWHAP